MVISDAVKQRIAEVKQNFLSQGIPAENIIVKEKVLYDTRNWRGNIANFEMEFFQIARGNQENEIAATEANQTGFLKTDAFTNHSMGGKAESNQHLILLGYKLSAQTDLYSKLKTLISTSKGIFQFKIGDEVVVDPTPIEEIIPYPQLIVKTGATGSSTFADSEYMIQDAARYNDLSFPFEIRPNQTFRPFITLKSAKTDEAQASDALLVRMALKVIEIRAKGKS